MGIQYIHHTDPNDPLYGQTEQVVTADPPTAPLILSKTAFQGHAVSKLGTGTTGMARFQEIMDDCAGSASGAVKFCFSRYEAAQTFEKTAVSNFTAIMVGAGIMQAQERTDVLNGWPEG